MLEKKPRHSLFGPSGGKSDALNPFLMVPRASFDQKIDMLKIRRRLIRSMRNRISCSVAVGATPETFQKEVVFVISKKNHRIRCRLIRSMRNRISYLVAVHLKPSQNPFDAGSNFLLGGGTPETFRNPFDAESNFLLGGASGDT